MPALSPEKGKTEKGIGEKSPSLLGFPALILLIFTLGTSAPSG